MKYSPELLLVAEHGIRVRTLDEIVEELLVGSQKIRAAAGGSLIDLVALRSLGGQASRRKPAVHNSAEASA